jgi:hypothetical protein
MSWNTNWVSSQGEGKLLKVALNNLKGALEERLSVDGTAIPAGVVTIGTGDIIKSNWFSDFQTAMTSMIGRYANHTDSGGDWDGVATIPAWTEATILAQIGDVSRLSAPTDPLISAAWMYQQYKLINELRWYRAQAGTDRDGTAKRSGTQATWALAESVMAAATPVPSSTDFLIIYSGAFTGSNYRKSYSTYGWQYTPGSGLTHDLDIYGYADRGAGDEFEDGLGFTEDTYGLVDTQTGITGFYEITPDINGADGNLTQPTGTRQMLVDDVIYIEKYDVTGGFTFKDW